MSAVWKLQDAKARLSEVVRLALTEGPQDITRHGEAAVTVLATTEYEAIKRAAAKRTGLDLMNALRCDAFDNLDDLDDKKGWFSKLCVPITDDPISERPVSGETEYAPFRFDER
jgi:antitoxin Phd